MAIQQGGNTALVTGAGALKVDTGAAVGIFVQSAIGGNTYTNKLGGSYASNKAASAGAVTIVAPGSNPNGIVVRSAIVSGPASANVNGLYSGTSAPTTATTNPPIVTVPGAALEVAQLPHDLWVPAGFGLYYWADTAAYGYSISYDIQ